MLSDPNVVTTGCSRQAERRSVFAVIKAAPQQTSTACPSFSWPEAFCTLDTSGAVVDVFEKLGLQAISKCALVCKHWNRLITNVPTLKARLDLADIFLGLYRLEDRLNRDASLRKCSMRFQSPPYSTYRKILVDWLIEVQHEYKLSTETLQISVLLLERCLGESDDIPRNKLQLLGVTCLFVASKFNETVHPLISDMVWVCDNSYTRQDHVEMEMKVMLLLQFQVYSVTPASYITALQTCLQEDMVVQVLAFYLANLGLVNGLVVRVPSSVIAASAVALALHTLRQPLRLDLIAMICRTTVSEVRKSACFLHKLQMNDHLEYGLGVLPAFPEANKPVLRGCYDMHAVERWMAVLRVAPAAAWRARLWTVRCCSNASGLSANTDVEWTHGRCAAAPT